MIARLASLSSRYRLQIAVVLYGVGNACLYANLLPLWDGFDEPFHYAYVEHLEHQRSVPVLGETHISLEIQQSLRLAPASQLVKRNIPDVITFDQYFRLPRTERIVLREQLSRIDPAAASAESGGLNYEAHQAPLAYVLMACVDRVWAGSLLPVRVLRLRLIAATLAVIGTGIVILRLLAMCGTPAAYQALTVFLVFSSQMFYATVAHVSNDWLAMILFSALALTAVELYAKPGGRRAPVFALVLSAGLLTKAYFLALVPFAIGLVLLLAWHRRLTFRAVLGFAAVITAVGVPWYARNLLRLGNLSGMQETAHGLAISELWRAAVTLPWARAIWNTLHGVLWTGNSSGTTFHARTIEGMLLLGLAALVLFLIGGRRHGMSSPDACLLSLLACFACGLVYVTAVVYWSTQGVGIGPSPWYAAIAIPPALSLLLHDLPCWGRAGRYLAIAFTWLWTYVMIATYLVKLVPFYGGYAAAHMQPAALLRWYAEALHQRFEILQTTAAGPLPIVLGLLILVPIAALAIASRLTRII